MPHIERRSYVRGNFSFKIKFRTITPAEYEELDMSNDTIFPQFQLTPVSISLTKKRS
jgi:hypothetical protein